MSEFGFIDRIAAAFAALPDHGFEGIGDDCAVLPIGGGNNSNGNKINSNDGNETNCGGSNNDGNGTNGNCNGGENGGDEALLFTTDMLVEGVHFLRRATTPEELGGKSLAVNLSDVAAMGATPIATLLSLSLPADAQGDWAERFMEGYRALSERYGVMLAGGDTTASQQSIVINVTAIGRAPLRNIKRRSAARPGDTILVGGMLGESGAGLRDILQGRTNTPAAACHRNPEPQVAEGIWLGARPEVRAMMDISDGLASDLRHILRASHVGAEVETERIPTAAAADLDTALCAGEDYKLLLTADADATDRLCADFLSRFGTPLHPIGRITASAGTLHWLRNGSVIDKMWQGYRHW